MKKILSILLLLCFSVLYLWNVSATYTNSEERTAANFLFREGIIVNTFLGEFLTRNTHEWMNLWGIPEMYDYLEEKGLFNERLYDDIDKDFRLKDSITRQEVMKIIAKLSWDEITSNCNGIFSDVATDGWGCKYIEWALSKWHIATNDTFRPEDKITKTEAMKLILKVQWIDKVQVTANWQEDYMMTAYNFNIIDEKYTDYNADATRGWIFVIATYTIENEEEITVKQNDMIISDEAL